MLPRRTTRKGPLDSLDILRVSSGGLHKRRRSRTTLGMKTRCQRSMFIPLNLSKSECVWLLSCIRRTSAIGQLRCTAAGCNTGNVQRQMLGRRVDERPKLKGATTSDVANLANGDVQKSMETADTVSSSNTYVGLHKRLKSVKKSKARSRVATTAIIPHRRT